MAKLTDAQLALQFVQQHMRSQGIKKFAQVEHVDQRATYVPSPEADADLQEYLASLSVGKDSERGAVFEILPEDIADDALNGLHTCKDAPESETPAEPEVILQSVRAAGEFVYDISEDGKVVWCWHREHAMRVKLSNVDEALQRLANNKIDALMQWA